MTDRHQGYLVILEHEIREDDAEPILSALKQIRGVLTVQPCIDTGWHLEIAKERVRRELSEKLWQVLYPK